MSTKQVAAVVNTTEAEVWNALGDKEK